MISPPDFLTITENSHRMVLNTIRIYSEISGADIARLSGLQPSTIVYILRKLEKKGFIKFSRTGNSTQRGGKKPNLWQIVPGTGKIVGIEVLTSKIRYVIIDFAGNLIRKGEHRIPYPLKGKNVTIALIAMLKKILSGQPVELFLGICLGVPGLVDTKNGILHHSSLLDISNGMFVNLLQKEFSLPVFIINDANAGALSIKWFNKSLNDLPENIVYLTYNDGSKNLGTGIIINRQLYHGASGFAGEIFRPLPCLNELLQSGIKKMGNHYPIAMQMKLADSLNFSIVCDFALEGCHLSAYVVNHICDFIADEIVRLTGLLNPDLIVLGGDITCNSLLLKKKIHPGVRKKIASLLNYTVPLPGIRFSEFGEFSVSMGAAAYILSTVLKPVN